MRRFLVLAAVLAAASGCATYGGSTVSLTPNPAGGGRAVTATIIAAMNGGLVGRIGSRLDNDDRRRALEAEYRALEYMPAGQSVSWQGGGGRRGDVVAAQPYRVGSQDCRQYSHAIVADGQQQSARGTACRNGDGSWTPLT